MSINVMDAILFPFEDRDWITKLAIALVLIFIPVIGWLILLGYGVRVVRYVLTDEEGLPEFDDWEGDLARGLAMAIGTIIYHLPSWIVSGIFTRLGEGFCVFQCVGGLFEFAYSLVVTPLLMSAVARYSLREDLDAFLDFRGRWDDLTRHVDQAIILWLNMFVLLIILAFALPIGLVMCVVPGLLVIAGMFFVMGHLTAQWGEVIGVTGGGKKKKVNDPYLLDE
jgi:hypothetical protein